MSPSQCYCDRMQAHLYVAPFGVEQQVGVAYEQRWRTIYAVLRFACAPRPLLLWVCMLLQEHLVQ